MEEKSNNANISPAKLLGKLKIILKLAITENCRVSLVAQLVKNSPANAGDARDTGSVPGLRKSPGVGNGNLLQYSCLEKFHGQRSLEDYIQSMESQRVRHN